MQDERRQSDRIPSYGFYLIKYGQDLLLPNRRFAALIDDHNALLDIHTQWRLSNKLALTFHRVALKCITFWEVGRKIKLMHWR